MQKIIEGHYLRPATDAEMATTTSSAAGQRWLTSEDGSPKQMGLFSVIFPTGDVKQKMLALSAKQQSMLSPNPETTYSIYATLDKERGQVYFSLGGVKTSRSEEDVDAFMAAFGEEVPETSAPTIGRP